MKAALTTYAGANLGSILPPLSGRPTPEQNYNRIVFTQLLQRDLPGQSMDNRYSQVDNYIGEVYVAINALMDGLKGAKISLQKKMIAAGRKSLGGGEADSDEWRPVGDNHPASRLFAWINPEQTLRTFIAEYVMMLELTGRAFTYAVPGENSGKPVELWVLRTPYVTPMYQATPNFPKGAWQVSLPMPMYGFGGGQGLYTIIDARDIVEQRLPHPRYGWDGYSPLSAGGQQIDTQRSAYQSRKNSLERGTSIDTVIQIPGAQENELRRIEAQYKAKYEGQNGARTIFTSGDDINIAGMAGNKVHELEYSQTVDQLAKFIFALFGVPSCISGMTDAGSYAQLYASLQQFRTNKLIPLSLDISEHLTKHLIHPHWGNDLRLVMELPALQNEEQQFQRYQHDSGILTVNQRLASDDKKPVEGGDVPESIYLGRLQAADQLEQQQKQMAMQAQMQPQGQPSQAMPSDEGQNSGQPGQNSNMAEVQSGKGDAQDAGQKGQNSGNEAEQAVNGAILSALGMTTDDGPTVKKSLYAYWKALQVEMVTTPSGAFAVRYSGHPRIYYGAQAREIWAKSQKIGSAKEPGKPDDSVNLGQPHNSAQGGRQYTGANAYGHAIKYEPDEAKKPKQSPTDVITGGVGPPPEGADKTPSGMHAPKEEAPHPSFVLHGKDSKGNPFKLNDPGFLGQLKSEAEAKQAFSALGGKYVETEGKAPWSKPTAEKSHVEHIADAVGNAPPEVKEHAAEAATRLEDSTGPVAKRLGKLSGSQGIPVAKMLSGPIARPKNWADALAEQHGDALAGLLGIHPDHAKKLISAMAQGFLRGLAQKLKIPLNMKLDSSRPKPGTFDPETGAEVLQPVRSDRLSPVNRLKPQGDGIPVAAGVKPPPKNKAGKGSLPPRVGKSLNRYAKSLIEGLGTH